MYCTCKKLEIQNNYHTLTTFQFVKYYTNKNTRTCTGTWSHYRNSPPSPPPPAFLLLANIGMSLPFYRKRGKGGIHYDCVSLVERVGVITIPNDEQNVLLGLLKSYSIVSKATAVNLMLCVCVLCIYTTIYRDLHSTTVCSAHQEPPTITVATAAVLCVYIHTFSPSTTCELPHSLLRIPVPVQVPLRIWPRYFCFVH